MTTIEINGCAIHHELHGDGDPLVLVHGGWTDADSWRFVLPALSDSFRVLTYDRRGHSRSERPAGQGSRRQDEDDLVGLVETLDLGPVHLVANSYGGSISLAVAVRRPDLVRTVAIHEPPLAALLDDGTRATVMATMQAVADDLAADVEGGTRRFMEKVALGPGSWALLPEEQRAVFIGNAPMFTDVLGDPHSLDVDEAGLAALEVPVLVSDGDHSEPWFAVITRALVDRIGPSEHRTFKGAGHAPHLTHVDDYVDAIGAFTAARVA